MMDLMADGLLFVCAVPPGVPPQRTGKRLPGCNPRTGSHSIAAPRDLESHDRFPFIELGVALTLFCPLHRAPWQRLARRMDRVYSSRSRRRIT